jgi:hypothetical protein
LGDGLETYFAGNDHTSAHLPSRIRRKQVDKANPDRSKQTDIAGKWVAFDLYVVQESTNPLDNRRAQQTI